MIENPKNLGEQVLNLAETIAKIDRKQQQQIQDLITNVPPTVTEETVSGWGFSKTDGTYTKPVGGIPKDDLELAVRNSLGKADTALQTFAETDPTVPDWAKAETKPTYTASEVGALPSTTVIPTVPTNVSAFNNDAGYLTEHQSLDAYARSEDLATVATSGSYTDLSNKPSIPSLISLAEKFVRFDGVQNISASDKSRARSNIGAGTYSKPSGGIPKTDLASDVIPTVSNTYSADSSDAMSGQAVASAISTALSSVYTVKGSKDTYADLPSSDNKTGDVWNVVGANGNVPAGTNYVWNGNAWDALGGTIDLSGYVQNTTTVNGKALSSNITLSASDVGALPSDTTIPTVTDTYSATSSDAMSGKAVASAISGKADSSALSSYLPLTGGTMTGSIVLKKSGVTKGTNPETAQYNAIHMCDSSGGTGYTGRTHTMEGSIQTNGNTTFQIRAYPWIAGATNYDGSALTVTCTPDNVYTCTVTGSFTATGDVVAYSDARLKENVEVIPDALNKVKSIRGVTFTRNDIADKEQRHMGVIAQELLDVVPEVVFETEESLTKEQIESGKTPETYYGVSYGNLTALLIEAVKEQQKQIEDLKKQIEELK